MYQPFRLLSTFFLGIAATLISCYSDAPVEQIAIKFTNSYREAFAAAQDPLMPFTRLADRLDSIQSMQRDLIALDTHSLSHDGRQKHAALELTLDREWAQWEPFRIDPSLYNIGGTLKKELVASAGSPAADRIRKLSEIMRQAPDYYATARQNLIVKDISLYRLAAQKQYLGLEFLRDELRDSLNHFEISLSERQATEREIAGTILAVKDYLGFCESVYLNHRDSTHYCRAESKR